ncbi:hypothetical protein PLICRDRAFT_551362 [Plicaturopsis crispa FD-325 SS-3]|nr:hypothetical protein PLICRDRAFT_551362 [Plicaturopsis crispa FD-325 SS-3]
MDLNHPKGVSPSQLPASSSKYHHPYFTPAEVDYLSEKQRGKLSATQEERVRQHACAFAEAVGAKIGFPRRTIATAQNLYHRFHLFFPRKDFGYQDVVLASLYVSTKMHDTLKKPRELLSVAYAVRPELASKVRSHNGEINLESEAVEHDRQRLLAVERLILETICFNFTSRMPFPYVIKIGRAFGASKKLTKLAWRLAVDSYRTLTPIKYPPHVVALGGLFIASLLSSFEQPKTDEPPGYRSSHEIAEELSMRGSWESKFQAQIEDLEEIAHCVIDLLIQAAENTSVDTSPRTPSSPGPHPAPRAPLAPPPAPYKADQLIRLKIAMREHEHLARPRQPLGNADPSALYGGDNVAMAGRNEGTVRFLFGPPSIVGQGV